MNEEISKIIEDIEKDITYFKNMGFDHLSEKFQRDLDIIKGLASSKG